jgi:hypothetical protein
MGVWVEPTPPCYSVEVVPTSSLVPGAVTQLIAAQPHSRGKVEAAWHLAVGGAMARLSAPVRDAGGVVYVQARSAGVADQLDLHRRVIEARLREVLGTHGRTFVLVTGRCA